MEAYTLGSFIKDYSQLKEFTEEEYENEKTIHGLFKYGDRYFKCIRSDITPDIKTIIVVSRKGQLKNSITEQAFLNSNDYWDKQTRIWDKNFGTAYSLNNNIKIYLLYYDSTAIIASKEIKENLYLFRTNRFLVTNIYEYKARGLKSRLKATLNINPQTNRVIIYSTGLIVSVIIFSFAYAYSNRYEHMKGFYYFDKWKREMVQMPLKR